MTHRSLVLLGAGLALAACEQADQVLPFENEPAAPVSRTLPASGGTLSSAAGAAISFPAGALAAGTEVTLTPGGTRLPAGNGQPLGGNSFELTPAGAQLAKPADAEFRIPTADPRAWLASVVSSTPAGVREIGSADVDLTSGLLRAPISVLGTLTPVIPAPDAVVAVRRGTAARAALPTSGNAVSAASGRTVYDATCGAVGKRCGIAVDAPRGLPGTLTDAAVVYPRIAGSFVVDGTAASGTLVLSGSVRLRVGAAATPVDVEITATADGARATANASGVALEGVRIVGIAGGETTNHVISLQIRHTPNAAEIVVAESLEIRVGNETYPVTITIPLARS